MEINSYRRPGANEITRASILVRGVVQGVGFRPFVHRLAHSNHLAGRVLNSTEGVEIEVEGTAERVASFLVDLAGKAPPAAVIHRIDTHYLPPAAYTSFAIETSQDNSPAFPLVSSDIATCPDCLTELFDAGDQRYRYPFINCTNCGPRFTIIDGVPYDRPRTTMKAFTMCPDCQSEYDDPANRRFHAQPNACPECGPSIWLQRDEERLCTGPDCIDRAKELLNDGKILAVKGLGGFHLACDATNPEAVRELRLRKRRVEKPFAIMVRDLETAGRLCYLTDAEAQLLSSSRRPIVLIERRPESAIFEEVALFNNRLGVMLPYTPLHHLLFRPSADGRFDALVMTSGNLGEEPIAMDNDEALSRLAPLADCFLLHNRSINARCDDSVTQVFDGRESIIRRSRGYAPLPVQLSFELESVIAFGAQLKSTFCIAQGNYAFLSQHIGDLGNQETLDFYSEAISHYRSVFNLDPFIVAHDLHPDYLSTHAAQAYLPRSGEAPLAAIAVQHHHAHITSCMAENGLKEQVIGVAFDGTGYGVDGRIWGGEFLIADYLRFQRAAHLRYVPLPGGDTAVRKPYRTAVSHLITAFGSNLPEVDFLKTIDPFELEIIGTQIARKINSPLTSSCGRLFDAVSALLGIRGEVNYEGQAAIELEMIAREDVTDAYYFDFAGGNPGVIDQSVVIRAIVEEMQKGLDRGVIAARFHNGVARMIAETCSSIRIESGLNKVCLSGGVFQNRFLLSRTLAALKRDDFETYTHHQVPCNDGGISLGQAIVASERVRALNA